MTKRWMGITLAAMMGISMAACGTSQPTTEVDSSGRVECDVDDQNERDGDCGFYDSEDRWVWWSWVAPGQTSYSPDGWTPGSENATTQTEESDESVEDEAAEGESEDGGIKVKKPKGKKKSKSKK